MGKRGVHRVGRRKETPRKLHRNARFKPPGAAEVHEGVQVDSAVGSMEKESRFVVFRPDPTAKGNLNAIDVDADEEADEIAPHQSKKTKESFRSFYGARLKSTGKKDSLDSTSSSENSDDPVNGRDINVEDAVPEFDANEQDPDLYLPEKDPMVIESSEAHCPPTQRNREQGSSHGKTHDKANPAIAKLLSVQRAILKQRVVKLSPHAKKKSRSALRHLGLNVEDAYSLSMEDAWRMYLDSLPRNFFSSAEAQLDNVSKVKKGEAAYAGLSVNAGNCADMREIFDTEWKTKLTNGIPVSTYDQFRVFAGQLCRFAVATKSISVHTLYKPGALYAIMTQSDLIKAFMGYFEVRCTAGTVMCKAMHALTLARYAHRYLSSQDGKEAELSALQVLNHFLRSTANANKTISRNRAAARKQEFYRAAAGKVLSPSDFESICSDLLKIVHGLEAGVRHAIEGSSGPELRKYVQGSAGLIEKWCLHFLNLCIFFGGGQRPQVFTLLERIDVLDFAVWDEEVKVRGYFSVKISNEKRIRDIDVPHVLFHKAVLPSFKFHIRIILPVLYAKRKIPRGDAKRNYLLLHTKTGDVLDSPSVTASLNAFMKRFDPEFGHLTTMTVRSSFASIMFAKFRQGQAFQKFEESEFLQYLAKVMNTSVEQLRDTYISTRSDDFHSSLKKVMSIMNSVTAGSRETSSEEEDNSKVI